MADFETEATIVATLDESSLRDVRADIEDELGTDPITVGTASGGGARADGGRSRRGLSQLRDTTESLVSLADERNTLLTELVEAGEAQALEEAQGGGSAILPTSVGGGAAGTAGTVAAGLGFQALVPSLMERARTQREEMFPGLLGDAIGGVQRAFGLSGVLGPGFQIDAQRQTIEDAQQFIDSGPLRDNQRRRNLRGNRLIRSQVSDATGGVFEPGGRPDRNTSVISDEFEGRIVDAVDEATQSLARDATRANIEGSRGFATQFAGGVTDAVAGLLGQDDDDDESSLPSIPNITNDVTVRLEGGPLQADPQQLVQEAVDQSLGQFEDELRRQLEGGL